MLSFYISIKTESGIEKILENKLLRLKFHDYTQFDPFFLNQNKGSINSMKITCTHFLGMFVIPHFCYL